MPDVAFATMYVPRPREMPDGKEMHLLAPQARGCPQGSNGGIKDRATHVAVKPVRHPKGVSPGPGTLLKQRCLPSAMISVHFPKDPEFDAVVQRHLDNPSTDKFSELEVGSREPYIPGQDPEPMNELAQAMAWKKMLMNFARR